MNGMRTAAARAVAFIFVGVLAGCGFTPKDAPMPDAANAVPVNRVEPDTRPWTEIYPPVASRTPKPSVEKITLAQDDHQEARVTKSEKQTVPVKPADKADPPKSAASTSKQISDPLPVPIPLPTVALAKSPPIAAVTPAIPKQGIHTQAHGENTSWPKLRTSFTNSMHMQTRAFGVPASKLDPVLMAAIAPVSLLTPTTMAPASPTAARPLPALSFGSAPIVQARAVLNGKIVMRDLTPSESKPVQEAQLPVARPHEPAAPKNITWLASTGTKLSDAVRNWGYQESPHWWVVWNTNSDFTIGSPYSIQAPDFLSASAQLFAAARQENHYFTVVKHPNHVLVVSTPTE